MSELAQTACEPCRGGMPPLDAAGIGPLLEQLHHDWAVVDLHHLHRRFEFPDFATALRLTNAIGEIAEDMGHHPDLTVGWGYVEVAIYTHAIGGLHLADFVFAAKVDELG